MPEQDQKHQTPEPEKRADPAFQRLKELSLHRAAFRANARAAEEIDCDVLPWEVPLKVVFGDDEPRTLEYGEKESDEPAVECATIRVLKRVPAKTAPGTYRLTIHKVHVPKETRYGTPYVSASGIYSRFVSDTEERRTWVLITAYGSTAAKALRQLEPGDQAEFTGRLTTKMGEYQGNSQRQWYLALGD